MPDNKITIAAICSIKLTQAMAAYPQIPIVIKAIIQANALPFLPILNGRANSGSV